MNVIVKEPVNTRIVETAVIKRPYHRTRKLWLWVAGLAFVLTTLCLIGWIVVATEVMPRDKFHVNAHTVFHPDENGKYVIHAEGIKASFIPYAASITDLIVADRYGIDRDIVLGYYAKDRQHPHFGSVPGRYLNRIKNGTFSIDGHTFHTDLNEHHGANTLHGGSFGWDYRDWTVIDHRNHTVSFSLLDEAGTMGFPGSVSAIVTYSVSPRQWHVRMTARAISHRTPIMLSSHVSGLKHADKTYWNLDGFAQNNTHTILDHHLHLPYCEQVIATDTILVPTGEILDIDEGSVNDFWSAPKRIGANFSIPHNMFPINDVPLLGNCGQDCQGYDNDFIIDRDDDESSWQDSPVAVLTSPWSGIELSVFTDQAGIQVYSCNGMNGSIGLKRDQGTPNQRFIQKHGCLVLEPEDWIDGINHPEWDRLDKQIFGELDEPYTWSADYRFDTRKTPSEILDTIQDYTVTNVDLPDVDMPDMNEIA